MTQKETLPGKYNPLKAGYYDRKPRDPAITARRTAFWEGLKDTAPKLYENHARETKKVETQHLIFETLLEDPATLALYDELALLYNSVRQKNLSVELSLLGIAVGSTKRDIRNAYRRKARKLHPDVGGDPDAFKQLHDAYRALLKVTPE